MRAAPNPIGHTACSMSYRVDTQLCLWHTWRRKKQLLISDGFVYLDGQKKPGLGKYLYDSLGGNIKIISVAKRPFVNIPKACEIHRGKSTKPLYVTAEGLTLDLAKEYITSMYGKYRVPALLKKADQICRKIASENELEQR